jgi:transcription termination factor Rho
MSDNETAGLTAGELESLEGKKLHELQTIAKSVGIKRVTGIRKVHLIENIREAAKKENSSKKEKSPEENNDIQKNDSSEKDSEMKNYGGKTILFPTKRRMRKRISPRRKSTRTAIHAEKGMSTISCLSLMLLLWKNELKNLSLI